MSDSMPARVRCRQIGAADLDSIADLLTVGFPKRSRRYWATALGYLARRESPEGVPRFGYMLESENAPVGVILLIFACVPTGNGSALRCNFSSWFVDPSYRSYASLLIARALRHPVTILNVSPAEHTLPIIEAQGFRRFCNGVFAALPALHPSKEEEVRILRIGDPAHLKEIVTLPELEMLAEHEKFGCISLWCQTPSGGHSFIFRRRFLKNPPLLPCAQLIYCDSLDILARFAGPIGRFLALRGMPFILIPSNGPIPNLLGRYYPNKPMYFRGPESPRLGDLAYTEAALFGF